MRSSRGSCSGAFNGTQWTSQKEFGFASAAASDNNAIKACGYDTTSFSLPHFHNSTASTGLLLVRTIDVSLSPSKLFPFWDHACKADFLFTSPAYKLCAHAK